MKWSKWKIGLWVAIATGTCTALAAMAIADHISLNGFFAFLGGCIAKDMGLYLRQHPVETIVTDTTFIDKEKP